MATSNHRPPPLQPASHPRRPHLTLAICTLTLLLLLHLTSPSLADGDWQSHCGLCHCTWSSGKKQADCRSHSFSSIPTTLTTELQVIDLSFNPIAELRRTEFQDAGLANMHKIYMRNCTMQEIHRGALSGLEVLIELDLSNNQLHTLHAGTFQGLLRLRTIMLNGNLLERLEDKLFENLTYLYKLEVRSNRLLHVGQRLFWRSNNVMNIALDQNQLTVLQPETFEKLQNLKELSLIQNPWNCTCTMQAFHRYVMVNKLYQPPTSCDQPAHLKGRLWSELQAENFACRPTIVLPTAPETTVEAHGENVTLQCRINGSPQPTVEWTFNRRTIGFGRPGDRVLIRMSKEMNRIESTDVYTSELTISGVQPADRGAYACVAQNLGGQAEAVFQVHVQRSGGYGGLGGIMGGGGSDSGDGLVQRSENNLLVVVCVVVIVLLAVLMVVIVLLCCYCRRIKKYAKNGSMGEAGLMAGKGDKGDKATMGGGGGGMLMGGMTGATAAGDSMLEGSVIMEMQKGLLTGVNPVEKPPRRVELDGGGMLGDGGMDEGMELKKTLLDDTMFGNQDDETHSVSLSDTTARSRTTYIDDGYGTNLPPDLLSFPSRFAQSPSLQSSISNIPEQQHQHQQHYMTAARSPPSAAAVAAAAAASPIYQHHPHHHALLGGHSIYAAATSTPSSSSQHHPSNSGYRTLQLPKQRNHMALHQQLQPQQHQQQQLHQLQQQHHPGSAYLSNMAHGTLRSHSPYNSSTTTAAAAGSSSSYPAVVMKQGYVTIPRKPRTPSWTPSLTSTMTADYPLLTSPTPSSVNGGNSGGIQSPDHSLHAALLAAEPVYDNLGLRTTASGNSALNLHKLATAAAAAQAAANAKAASTVAEPSNGGSSPGNNGARFPMKDRPLPATPRGAYEAIPETAATASAASPVPPPTTTSPTTAQQLQDLQQQQEQLLESLYGTRLNPDAPRTVKVPPRPPPKPKKRTGAAGTSSATTANASSASTGAGHPFEDECEDGTEV